MPVSEFWVGPELDKQEPVSTRLSIDQVQIGPNVAVTVIKA